MIRILWIAFCMTAGAAIGAALGSTAMGRMGLIGGAVLGAGLGMTFGRYVGIVDCLG